MGKRERERERERERKASYENATKHFCRVLRKFIRNKIVTKPVIVFYFKPSLSGSTSIKYASLTLLGL